MDHDRLFGTFLAIARSGGISHAARQLGASSATTSRQLEALESHLGVRLFDRTTRTVRLTAAGQRLLPHAEAVLQALDDARDSVDSGSVQSNVRVCAPIAIGLQWVSACLADLPRQQSGLQVELVLENRISDAWVEGIDILVRTGLNMHKMSPDLVVRSLGSFSLGVYASPGLAPRVSPDSPPEALSALPWVGHLGFGFGNGLIFRLGRRESTLRVKPSLWSSDVMAVTAMVESGQRCAVLPRWLATPKVATGHLVAILRDWELPPVQLWLAWRNSGGNRKAVTWVAHQLRDQIQPLVAQG